MSIIVRGPNKSCCINPFPNKPRFLRFCSASLKENTAGKGEITPFPQCFLLVWRTFCHFCQMCNCRLLKLSEGSKIHFLGKGYNPLPHNDYF